MESSSKLRGGTFGLPSTFASIELGLVREFISRARASYTSPKGQEIDINH